MCETHIMNLVAQHNNNGRGELVRFQRQCPRACRTGFQRRCHRTIRIVFGEPRKPPCGLRSHKIAVRTAAGDPRRGEPRGSHGVTTE